MEREYILHRLQALERRFKMKHFQRLQVVLRKTWKEEEIGDDK
jgi:hypothetical protein